MTVNCENCMFFDSTKHEKDPRTKHAGICSKWTEIVFKSDTCKQFFSSSNPTVENLFKTDKTNNQIALFL